MCGLIIRPYFPLIALSAKFDLLESNLGDIELVNALHGGSRLAYTIIYERFVMQLQYYISSITGNDESSEEIASETFIKAFRRKEDFSTVEDLKNFLFRVATNGALDYVKVQKRYRDHLGKWVKDQKNWENDVHLRYIEAEAVALVYQEIEKLPEPVREVVRLSLLDHLSPDEIAGRLNIANKTVRNYKSRGLAMLRESLSGNTDVSPYLVVLAINLLQAHT